MFEIISLFEYFEGVQKWYYRAGTLIHKSKLEICSFIREMLRPLIPLYMIGFTVYIHVWLHNNPRDIIFESQPFVIKMFIKTYRTLNELVTVNRYNFHICVYNIFHKPQPLCERILGSITYWYTRPPWFLKTIIKSSIRILFRLQWLLCSR